MSAIDYPRGATWIVLCAKTDLKNAVKRARLQLLSALSDVAKVKSGTYELDDLLVPLAELADELELIDSLRRDIKDEAKHEKRGGA